MRAVSSDGDHSIDALRLSGAASREIHRSLDGEAQEADYENRGNDRFRYRTGEALEVRVAHPGGSEAIYQVTPRNISNTGIGFLHGSYLHLGAACDVLLTDDAGHRYAVRGKVVRCRFIKGRIHDVGIRFEEKLDIDRFVMLLEPEVVAGSPENDHDAQGPTSEGPTSGGPTSGGGGMLRSALWGDPQMQDLVPGYVQHLVDLLGDLARSLGVQGACGATAAKAQDFGTAASSYGYPSLAAVAHRLAQSLARGEPVTTFKPILVDLARLCDAARRAASG